MCVTVVLPAAANAAVQRSFPGCPILRQGASGTCVRHLQSDLDVVKPAYRLPITGVFGAQTLAAVRSFQAQYHLPVTGVVDFVTAGSLDQFSAGARSLARSSKPKSPHPAPPAAASSSGAETTDADITEAEKELICRWTATVIKAPAILAGPEAKFAAEVASKDYDSLCSSGTKGLRRDAATNLIDATVGYGIDKGLDATFEKPIEAILASVGSDSKAALNVSTTAWNTFILRLIQRLRTQEVKCEMASRFPPPITCSTQTLTNHLLGLIRR